MTFSFNNNEQKKEVLQSIIYDPVICNDLFSDKNITELISLASSLKTVPAEVGGVNNNGAIEAHVRRSNVVWVTPDICPSELSQFFRNVFMEVNKKHFEFDITGTEAYQYSIYDASYAGTYTWHIDTMALPDNTVRKISMSLLLSDQSEFEGGKLLLNPSGNIIVAEERKGRAIFFPSWMQHCVTPVTKGTRKSLVIWAHGPKFK